MKDKSKYQYVFSMKLAGLLMVDGFRLLRINKHLKDNTHDVYVFEKSEEIQRYIENYIKAKEKYYGDNDKGS